MRTVALIPAYNEDATIAKVILGCKDFCGTVLVCDDGSTDFTAKIAEGLGCTLIRHERNEGKGNALRDLFRRAAEMRPESVVTIDADGQHDPRDIPKLLEGLKDAEIVIGSRVGVPPFRAAGNLILRGFSKLDSQSGFRAYRGYTLAALIPSEDGMAGDSEILRMAQKYEMRVGSVDIKADYSVRNASKKHFVTHFLEVLSTEFKLWTFRHPLRLYGIPGLVVLLASIWFGWGAQQYLLTEGLGSVVLFLVAAFLLEMAVLIWTVESLRRR